MRWCLFLPAQVWVLIMQSIAHCKQQTSTPQTSLMSRSCRLPLCVLPPWYGLPKHLYDKHVLRVSFHIKSKTRLNINIFEDTFNEPGVFGFEIISVHLKKYYSKRHRKKCYRLLNFGSYSTFGAKYIQYRFHNNSALLSKYTSCLYGF